MWIVFLVFPIILSAAYFILPAPQAQAALSDGLVGNSTFDGKDTNWNTNKTNDGICSQNRVRRLQQIHCHCEQSEAIQ